MARSKHLLLAIFFSLAFHTGVIWLAIESRQNMSEEGVSRRLSVTLVSASQARRTNGAEGLIPPSVQQLHTPANSLDGSDQDATETSPIPLPIGPKFYDARDLSKRPAIISRMPDDPESIRTDPNGGSAVLEIWILESGLVARVIAVKSDLSASTLNGLVELFSQATFAPGLIADNPVNTILTIEVTVNKRAPQKAPPPPQKLQ